jgi:cytochrome c oxidase subunit III
MASTLEQVPVAGSHGGGSLPPADARRDGSGRSGGLLSDPARLGLWLFLGTVTMLFVGFTSAYIARRGSGDWRPLALPPVLWANSLALVASSVTLEIARRRLRRWEPGVVAWLSATGGLGALFVAGQLTAWRTLTAQGFLLASNPHNSFFYILTGLHVVHVLGAFCWFGVVLWKARRMKYTPGQDGLGLFATFWHFLGVLWLYLFLLLFVI